MQPTHVKVAKFGGSSLADAGQFLKVADIVRADPERRFVVPSAPGKRSDSDIKVTDLLISAVNASESGKPCEAILERIFDRFDTVISSLKLSLSLEDEYEKIRQALSGGRCYDYVVSRGEYLSGRILAKLLDYEFIDPADGIFFNENGLFDPQKSYPALTGRLEGLKNAVIPGFYGSAFQGGIKTFSRGGSDITGSIVARAANADLYENWTDVPGFLMADPHIVEHPRTIKTITYRELRELSYMGATVMHEESVFPVRERGIPINIRNTNDPAAPGTMIVASTDDMDMNNVITGIAGKKGFCIIIIEKEMMNTEIGFGRKVLSVLENHRLSFEHMPSGIDSLCVIVNEHEISGMEKQVLDEIMLLAQPDVIRLERGLALIAVVGRAMKSSVGTASRLFRCIAGEGINIRMIDQGSSELNIILGVDEKSFETAVNAIYHSFVK